MDLTTFLLMPQTPTPKEPDRKPPIAAVVIIGLAVLAVVAIVFAVDGCPRPQPPPAPADTHPVDVEPPAEGGQP